MTSRAIGRAALTAGLGVLLLVAGGIWEGAEGDGRRHGRSHHRGVHGRPHHFHGHLFVGPRFHVGPRAYPYYYGGYYYGSYAYEYVPPPPVVVTPPASYVERPPATGYWHYCHDPAGYYPDVPQCPGGWTLVPPRSE